MILSLVFVVALVCLGVLFGLLGHTLGQCHAVLATFLGFLDDLGVVHINKIVIIYPFVNPRQSSNFSSHSLVFPSLGLGARTI